jgi:hypothetical protein
MMTTRTPLEKAIANFKVAKIGLSVATKDLDEALTKAGMPDTIDGLNDLISIIPEGYPRAYRIYAELFRLEDAEKVKRK